MDKILRTQLGHIYNHIDAQAEEIEIAARLLAQAVESEGRILLKTFHDFKGIEELLLGGELALPDIAPFQSVDDTDTPDRVFIAGSIIDDGMKSFIQSLQTRGIEFVLIATFNKKESEFIDTINHYIDLNSPRPLVPTPNFDKIINPYINVFLYAYYHLYTFIDEMTNDEYE